MKSNTNPLIVITDMELQENTLKKSNCQCNLEKIKLSLYNACNTLYNPSEKTIFKYKPIKFVQYLLFMATFYSITIGFFAFGFNFISRAEERVSPLIQNTPTMTSIGFHNFFQYQPTNQSSYSEYLRAAKSYIDACNSEKSGVCYEQRTDLSTCNPENNVNLGFPNSPCFFVRLQDMAEYNVESVDGSSFTKLECKINDQSKVIATLPSKGLLTKPPSNKKLHTPLAAIQVDMTNLNEAIISCVLLSKNIVVSETFVGGQSGNYRFVIKKF